MARRGLQGECGYCILYIGPIGEKGTGGVPKMIYILWKFILLGGGVLFHSPKGFLIGILMLLLFNAY